MLWNKNYTENADLIEFTMIHTVPGGMNKVYKVKNDLISKMLTGCFNNASILRLLFMSSSFSNAVKKQQQADFTWSDP